MDLCVVVLVLVSWVLNRTLNATGGLLMRTPSSVIPTGNQGELLMNHVKDIWPFLRYTNRNNGKLEIRKVLI